MGNRQRSDGPPPLPPAPPPLPPVPPPLPPLPTDVLPAPPVPPLEEDEEPPPLPLVLDVLPVVVPVLLVSFVEEEPLEVVPPLPLVLDVLELDSLPESPPELSSNASPPQAPPTANATVASAYPPMGWDLQRRRRSRQLGCNLMTNSLATFVPLGPGERRPCFAVIRPRSRKWHTCGTGSDVMGEERSPRERGFSRGSAGPWGARFSSRRRTVAHTRQAR